MKVDKLDQKFKQNREQIDIIIKKAENKIKDPILFSANPLAVLFPASFTIFYGIYEHYAPKEKPHKKILTSICLAAALSMIGHYTIEQSMPKNFIYHYLQKKEASKTEPKTESH